VKVGGNAAFDETWAMESREWVKEWTGVVKGKG